MFVNREDELAALEAWWARPADGLALVWGRRRVGKTWLVSHFARNRRSVVHTGANRAPLAELALLSQRVAAGGLGGFRDLATRPLASWDEALDALASAAADEPVLLVLDEFPELIAREPSLPAVLRAFWDRAQGRTALKVLLCGSAVRTMSGLERQREPLYGRFGLRLAVHPFTPWESGLMLPELSPAQRALVWGITGGVPLYLSWWNQHRSIAANLADLVGTPSGRMLIEGQLVLATEGDQTHLSGPVLRAIASGSTKFNEIADAVGTDPTRTLELLTEVRLVERLVPVTDDPSRTRRRIYRVSDNFHSFWLGVVDPYRGEIDQGLREPVIGAIVDRLDEHMGPRWEDAYRSHLRRLASAGRLAPDVVAVGSWWRSGVDQIDAVALAGRGRRAVLVGEAKWTERVDARRLEAGLRRAAAALPDVGHDLRVSVCARREVRNAGDRTLVVTAADIFAT